MRQILGLLLIMVVVSGCSGKFKYTPPAGAPDIKNSFVVEMPKDEVWKRIMSVLGSTFFAFNHLDKDSGLINISYSDDPELYLDCGKIYSYVMKKGDEKTYEFPASQAHQAYEIYDDKTGFHKIRRKMSLNGRINIIVQDISQNRTKVTVNGQYNVTNSRVFFNNHKDTISFTTNGSDIFSDGIICHCNGLLEKRILSLLELIK